jgi:hypothetical protein
MTASLSLVLVHQPGCQDVRDFVEIAELASAKAPDIEVFVAHNDRLMPQTRRRAAMRPTFVFSPGQLDRFRPARGKVYAGSPMPKLVELDRLSAAGLPVPVYRVIEPGIRLDPGVFGPFVVVKPGDMFASAGRGVELRRTEAVRHLPKAAYPAGHPGRTASMIAQRYIDTGNPAVEHRVLTLFGEPLYAARWHADRERGPLDRPDAALRAARICAGESGFAGFELINDPDILELARRTYRALPDIPLQGVDIVRDQRDGSLYVLEVNPGGNTWHFSSSFAGVAAEESVRRKDQFGAFEVAARVLVERTRAEAI